MAGTTDVSFTAPPAPGMSPYEEYGSQKPKVTVGRYRSVGMMLRTINETVRDGDLPPLATKTRKAWRSASANAISVVPPSFCTATRMNDHRVLAKDHVGEERERNVKFQQKEVVVREDDFVCYRDEAPELGKEEGDEEDDDTDVSRPGRSSMIPKS